MPLRYEKMRSSKTRKADRVVVSKIVEIRPRNALAGTPGSEVPGTQNGCTRLGVSFVCFAPTTTGVIVVRRQRKRPEKVFFSKREWVASRGNDWVSVGKAARPGPPDFSGSGTKWYGL